VFISCDGTNQNKQRTKYKLLFEDSGTAIDWQSKWMMDGLRSKVVISEKGMELVAGAEYGNDSCHTVLWTKKSFKGDVRIEYDYTRTDTTTRCVNIIYFHATGKGTEEYPEDISLWNEKRKVPHMRTYFNNMNTYHISYAAFSAEEYSGDNDYIRLRRYDPDNNGLNGTDISGEYVKTGLFKPNITYHIAVVKRGGTIEIRFKNTQDLSDSLFCKWDVSEYPSYDYGRIGFRHMYTRNAIYKNIKVWRIE